RNQRMFDHERELAAGQIKDDGCAEGDGEVADQADDGGGPSAVEGGSPQQARRDGLQDADRRYAAQAIAKEGAANVENAAGESAHQDREKRSIHDFAPEHAPRAHNTRYG